MANKAKTKRAAVKRFKKTGSGIKRTQSHRRHILTKKSTKRKRQLRSSTYVEVSGEVNNVKRLIGDK